MPHIAINFRSRHRCRGTPDGAVQGRRTSHLHDGGPGPGRHEFPTEWARFKSQTATEEARFLELRLPIAEEHYPFWTRGRVQGVEAVDLLVLPADEATSTLAVARTANPTDDDAAKDVLRPEMPGLLGARLNAETLASPFAPDPVSLFFEINELKDAWLAVAWRSAEA